mmetsp:Transcript_35049/g.76387  ORF Transcript_35049/g.76387 Transcript_35049/m.76387 type:complete len:242 (+) Transcript_35049:627-1352(+)
MTASTSAHALTPARSTSTACSRWAVSSLALSRPDGRSSCVVSSVGRRRSSRSRCSSRCALPASWSHCRLSLPLIFPGLCAAPASRAAGRSARGPRCKAATAMPRSRSACLVCPSLSRSKSVLGRQSAASSTRLPSGARWQYLCGAGSVRASAVCPGRSGRSTSSRGAPSGGSRRAGAAVWLRPSPLPPWLPRRRRCLSASRLPAALRQLVSAMVGPSPTMAAPRGCPRHRPLRRVALGNRL